jgi:hypothetical protein
LVSVVQLKPLQDSFYDIVQRKLPRLDVLVLCEGRSDVEVAKEVLRGVLEVAEPLGGVSVGFTDCEGIGNVPTMTNVVLSLARVSRRLRGLAVVIDADEYSVDDRVRGVVDSLTSRGRELGVRVSVPQGSGRLDQVYLLEVSVDRRCLDLAVAISGDFSAPYRRRCLEDHCAKLMGLRVGAGVESSKRLVTDMGECLRYIRERGAEEVCRAFEHLCLAFQLLLSRASRSSGTLPKA